MTRIRYALQAAAFPRFFKRGDAAGGLKGTRVFALRILKRTAPLSLLMAAGIYFIASAIPHLVGHGFAGSVSALRWLCLLPLFRSCHLSAGDALTGAGHQKTRLGTQGLAAGFNFVANLFLISHYGWEGGPGRASLQMG